ncbi:hypothetical protein A8L34_05810 [Bacillus sp. FJAT-27264]|nr:hypothetical protein A8L34_05810 [Bacillus sp. FJAT-27264]
MGEFWLLYRGFKWMAYSLSLISLAVVVGCSNNSNVVKEDAKSNVESKIVEEDRTPQEILTVIKSKVAKNDMDGAVKDYRILEQIDKDSVLRTAQARGWIKTKYLVSGNIDAALSIYDGITNELILSEKEKIVEAKQILTQATQLETEKRYVDAADSYKEVWAKLSIPDESYFYGKYISNTLEGIKSLIRDEKYEQANELTKQLYGNSEASALRNYINAKQAFIKGDKERAVEIIEVYLRGYTGDFLKEVDDLKLSLKPRDYWYESDVEYYQVQEMLNKVDPTIGMSVNELKKSRWGQPKEINKTTTDYGTSEQWVYSGFRYVYVNDGIVTGIQE